jgi:hypothetical protein
MPLHSKPQVENSIATDMPEPLLQPWRDEPSGYCWPASRLTPNDMQLLCEVRKLTRCPITKVLQRAVRYYHDLIMFIHEEASKQEGLVLTNDGDVQQADTAIQLMAEASRGQPATNPVTR